VRRRGAGGAAAGGGDGPGSPDGSGGGQDGSGNGPAPRGAEGHGRQPGRNDHRRAARAGAGGGARGADGRGGGGHPPGGGPGRGGKKRGRSGRTAMTQPESERVLILDFGSQYGQLIARRVREQNVFCQVVRHDLPAARVAELAPRGLILSGGPASVYE